MTDSDASLDTTDRFLPAFEKGMLTAVVVDVCDNTVLMVAMMDEAALAESRRTGKAHFFSRSRGKLWRKGESSGNELLIEEILVDCDQDALVLRCRPQGPTCHTGVRSCFYRRVENERLVPIA